MWKYQIKFIYACGDIMTATYKADSMIKALEKAIAYKKASKQLVSEITIKIL